MGKYQRPSVLNAYNQTHERAEPFGRTFPSCRSSACIPPDLHVVPSRRAAVDHSFNGLKARICSGARAQRGAANFRFLALFAIVGSRALVLTFF